MRKVYAIQLIICNSHVLQAKSELWNVPKMFPISPEKKRNEKNGWNFATIYCGFEINRNPYIVVRIENRLYML